MGGRGHGNGGVACGGHSSRGGRAVGASVSLSEYREYKFNVDSGIDPERRRHHISAEDLRAKDDAPRGVCRGCSNYCDQQTLRWRDVCRPQRDLRPPPPAGTGRSAAGPSCVLCTMKASKINAD